MLLGFKTELDLNNEQRTAMAKHAGVARHAYNWGLWFTQNLLKHNKVNPNERLKFPSAIDLHKILVAIVKPEYPWYREVSKCAPQYALKHLRMAWSRCFEKTGGAPKFKKKGKHDSFELDGTIKIRGSNHIQLPVIGIVKTFESLPQVQPKSVTISKVADRWFVSFRIEAVDRRVPNNKPKTKEVVGVDLGVKTLAFLSTGESFTLSPLIKQLEEKIQRLQWLNRHKQRGSANSQKAQRRIAKLWYRVTCLRRDVLHKLTTYLAKNFETIVIENLNVSGMLANHKLARAIQRCGFYEFKRQLEYKVKLYGSSLVVADCWMPSSKTCSNCGAKKEILSLSEREYKCQHCGFELDRDLNAAINLEKVASPVI